MALSSFSGFGLLFAELRGEALHFVLEGFFCLLPRASAPT